MKETNIIIAISNIIRNPILNIVSYYRSSNRINNVGEALEFYVKDVFCDSLNIKDVSEKIKTYNKYFSYLGNQNNPPDIMIKGGDAFEIKKVEGFNSGLALNSSYPKDKIYSTSKMITTACRNCEEWSIKDMFYIVGVSKNNVLKSIWLVQGDCYAASRETYERIREKVSEGVNELPGIEFSETRELGRVNKVDPLGITYLRIRGMWGIENPSKVFGYLNAAKDGGNFVLNALMTKSKYNQFPKGDRMELEGLKSKGLEIDEVEVKDPNNPAKLLNAILISFSGGGR